MKQHYIKVNHTTICKFSLNGTTVINVRSNKIVRNNASGFETEFPYLGPLRAVLPNTRLEASADYLIKSVDTK